VADLRDGSVAMLENLRFAAGEEANDETFSRALASYADVYTTMPSQPRTWRMPRPPG